MATVGTGPSLIEAQRAGDEVIVEAVTTSRDLETFISFPFKLYAGSKQWVPPFIEERRAFFNRRKNPFFEHAEYQLFLARRNGKVVGTIGAVVDHRHNEIHAERAGAFGFLELINDPYVATALFQAAEAWVRGQGMRVVRGPLNFSTNHECGLLIDGFDEAPMIMMTYNPTYYARLIESTGYVKAQDLLAFVGNLDELWENGPRKAFRAAELAIREEGIRVRRADMRHFDRDVALATQIYNHAWERNWGFVPLTQREFQHISGGLKPFLDPHLLFIAEAADGAPVGVSISLPDLNQPLLWGAGGHMFPLGIAKMMWYRRRISQFRLTLLGVAEDYRGFGLEAFFLVETVRSARERGYRRMEGSWILESNDMMIRISQRLGMRRYKTYRLYEKRLGLGE
jgi:GNAT superfamily N-acetyltransferase